MRNLKDFGNILQSIRLRHGCYQYEFAQRLCMDKADYSRLENGKLHISLDKFIFICNKLHIHINLIDIYG